MMMAEKSEQALTALERSKSEPTHLLRDAAAILGLNFDIYERQPQSTKTLTSNRKSLEFRQQWVLRWLLRKLAQASEKDGQAKSMSGLSHDDRNFIQDPRTWKLLEALICGILEEPLLTILFERNFFKVFTNCLAIASEQLDEASSTIHQDQKGLQSDGGSTRPRKRPKLSPPLLRKDHQDKETSLQMIRVAQMCSSAIKSNFTGKDGRDIRNTLPAWSNSISEAAEFLGSLLRLSVLVYDIAQESKQPAAEENTDEPVRQWLFLWDAYVSANSQSGSSEANKQFNKHCLPPALDLIAILNAHEDNQTLEALKRAVALYTILPMRNQFEQKFARSWKQDRDFLSWSDIEPIYEVVTKQIDSLGLPLKLCSDNIDSSRIFRPLLLLQVSSNLIPPSNNRRWHWEQPWLEALFICLVYFTCGTYMPKLRKGDAGNSTEIKLSEHAGHWSASDDPAEVLTGELISSGTEISLPLLSYYVTAMLSWRDHTISLNAVSQLLKMDSGVFIPGTSGENGQICLDKLCERLVEERIGSHKDLDKVSSDICVPLLQGFAKTRDFGDVTDFLQMRLVDSFYWRIRHMVDDSTYRGVLSWDDEDVLGEFRSLCFKHSSPMFAKGKLQEAVDDLEGIFSIVGSTNEVFAKLTICEQLILAFEEEFFQHTGFEDNLSRLATAAIKALGGATDFQGQRWRLWELLRVISKILPAFSIDDRFKKMLRSDLFKHLEQMANVSKPFQKSSQLMEMFQRFALAVEYAGKISATNDLTNALLSQVSAGIRDWYASSSSELPEQLGVWDGKFRTLKTTAQMWCGCLAKLSANCNLLVNDLPTVKAFVVGLCRISMTAYVKDIRSSNLSLPSITEALLTSAHRDRTDLLSLYNEALENHVEESQANLTVPTLLQEIIRTNPSKREAERTSKILTKYFLSKKNSLLSPGLVSVLELLSQIVRRHAIHIGHPDNFELLTTSFSSQRLPTNSHALITAMRCIQSLIHVLWRRLQNQENRSKKDRNTTEIWQWLRKAISRHDEFDFENLESIFVLEIMVIISEQIAFWEPALDKATLTKMQMLCQNYLADWIIKVTESDFSSIAAVKLRYALLHYCNLSQLTKGDHANRTFRVRSSVRTWLSNEIGYLPQEEALLEDVMNSIQQQLVGLGSEQKSQMNVNESKTAKSRLEGLLGNAEYPLELLAKWAQEIITQLGHRSKFEILRGIFDDSNILDSTTEKRSRLVEGLVGAKIILDTTSEELRSSSDLSSTFSRIVSLEASTHARDTTQLTASIELCTIILELHPDFINQSTIDTILKSIAAICSWSCETKSTESLNSVPAACIFERLCDVILLLLSRYRRRLVGRYHLLLPPLQKLLRCLFYSSSHTFTSQNAVILRQQLVFLRSLPHWLKDPSGNEDALPPASAEKFSRILQTLCNPTTSAARSAKKRSKDAQALGLNDETKKVRRVAAQHMQYLVMTYSQVSLEGYIAPDVKERLLPGLYAILSAMDMDLMRAMNAAMDTSARAIFKALYDDWVRYGKWNQT